SRPRVGRAARVHRLTAEGRTTARAPRRAGSAGRANVMVGRSRARRGVVGIVGAVVLGGGALLSPATSGAAAGRGPGHGRVRCRMAGKAKYKPALLPAALPGKVLSLTATLTCGVGQTGNGSVVVTGGKLQATSAPFTGGCSAPNPSSLAATIKWKATG